MTKETERHINWDDSKLSKNQKPNGKNYLLVIGIDKYKHSPRLNNAVRDAQAFKKILLDRYNFQPEHVWELFDGDATRKNILDALLALENRIAKDDNFILYYSGHGSMNQSKSKGFWVPVDAESQADYIPNSRIKDHLDDIKAHHIYLIVDSCFSGSIVARSDEFTKRVEALPSRRVLTSGRSEMVSDGKVGKHSPFAYSLLEYLRTYSGPLPASRLEQHVKEHTPRTAKQTPSSAYIYGLGDQGGEFIFHPKVGEGLPNKNIPQEKASKYQFPIRNTFLAVIMLTIATMTIILWPKGEDNQQPETHDLAGREILESTFKTDGNTSPAMPLEEKMLHDSTINKRKIKLPVQIPKPELKEVTGGSFSMGSNEGEDDEKPVHQVTIATFSLGVYEVTNEEYCAFLNQKNPLVNTLKNWIDLNGRYNNEKCRISKIGNSYIVDSGYEKHPVTYVSWYGAKAYCKWLGDGYRLPTEAEWEYAAGGGELSRTIYPGTNNGADLDTYSVYTNNSNGVTARVGSKKANQLGFFDMSGNVWEWCNDRYYNSYLSALHANPRGQGEGIYWVCRGGGWRSNKSDCRAARRFGTSPVRRASSIGFRVAR